MFTSFEPDLLAILILGVALGEGYAALLRPLEHLYNPHYTWITVIGGVVLTWLLFVLLAICGYVPWASVWWFVVVFCLTAVGILRWQFLQLRDHWQRKKARTNGKVHARRESPD